MGPGCAPRGNAFRGTVAAGAGWGGVGRGGVWCDCGCGCQRFRRALLKGKRPAGAPACPVARSGNKLEVTDGESRSAGVT